MKDTTTSIELEDGRQIGFAEFGDPTGRRCLRPRLLVFSVDGGLDHAGGAARAPRQPDYRHRPPALRAVVVTPGSALWLLRSLCALTDSTLAKAADGDADPWSSHFDP
jgi:hypothetical protein